MVLSAVHNIDQRVISIVAKLKTCSDTAYGKMIWSCAASRRMCRRLRYVAFALGGFGTPRGSRRARRTWKDRPCRVALLHRILANWPRRGQQRQPSSKFDRGPQLPICTNSHGIGFKIMTPRSQSTSRQNRRGQVLIVLPRDHGVRRQSAVETGPPCSGGGPVSGVMPEGQKFARPISSI